jgi:hypothetical protein
MPSLVPVGAGPGTAFDSPPVSTGQKTGYRRDFRVGCFSETSAIAGLQRGVLEAAKGKRERARGLFLAYPTPRGMGEPARFPAGGG